MHRHARNSKDRAGNGQRASSAADTCYQPLPFGARLKGETEKEKGRAGGKDEIKLILSLYYQEKVVGGCSHSGRLRQDCKRESLRGNVGGKRRTQDAFRGFYEFPLSRGSTGYN